MKKNFIGIFLAFVLIATNVVAQSSKGKIYGAVINGNQKPVEGASISLLKAKDSSLVKITVAGKSGNFELEKLDGGNYLLSITAVGYSAFVTQPQSLGEGKWELNIGNITLQESNTSLNAVTVVARKPLIEQKADRTIVNVDAAVTNVGATALEVLEKSPGVSVDRDGNISLKGKQGVLVMIDGKPTYLSNADLATMLGSMSANQLDQIEIMTNPPAKYDAAGNSGIINIKTKKNKQKGFNGNASLSYGQGRYWKTNNSINLNYRDVKYNLFLNYSLNGNAGFSDLHIKRTYYDKDGKTVIALFDQPTNMTYHGTNNTLKLGMDYYLKKKTTVGFVANGFVSPHEFNSRSTGYLNDAFGKTDSIADTKSNNNERWKNGSVNLNFRRQINDSSEINADFDFIQYNSNNNQHFYNNTFFPDGSVIEVGELKGVLPSDIKIYSGKADYSKMLMKGLKLDAGVKSSLVKTDNMAEYHNLSGGEWEPDYDKSNHFLYEENINAAYLNFNKPLKKWTVQAGLRFENTNYKGHQLGNAQKPDSAFSRNYNSLFPTAFISYAVDSNNTFSINAGRRIDRPAYQDLNPFIFFINKFTYATGNPFLQPQYTNNFELTHSYKNRLTTTLSYSKTSSYITQVFRTEGEVTTLSDGNLGTMENFGISMSTQLNLTKWWSLNLSGNLNYRKVDGESMGTVIKTEGVNGQVNANNQFKFNKGWAAELSGFYNSRNVEGQFEIGGFGQVSTGVSKQVFKEKGSVKFNVRDIFYSSVINGQITYGNVIEHFIQSHDSRVFTLAFTYRFGKTFKDAPRRNNGGASDEQSRVRAGG
jgi:iron complex outermembrane recepter protein